MAANDGMVKFEGYSRIDNVIYLTSHCLVLRVLNSCFIHSHVGLPNAFGASIHLYHHAKFMFIHCT